jgi:D-alanine-D-alanine ligase-like ATP-grasp enzyme
VKPRADGCSAGIVRLRSSRELSLYCDLARREVAVLERDTFHAQSAVIEMSSAARNGFLLEPFIETDRIEVRDNALHHTELNGWIELTVGVLEQKGSLHSLHPSIAVAENFILSLEEKFQGGTGINLTPPPADLISAVQCADIRERIEKAARTLGIGNYARLDIFFNTRTNVMLLIEANTLPGLTPSTVIYHQALSENPPMPPLAFLEHIIAATLSP